jgi:polyhydroxyalkanoate synthase
VGIDTTRTTRTTEVGVLGGLDPLGLVDSLTQVFSHVGNVQRSSRSLGAEWARILTGRSQVAAEDRDWRFRHDAWSSNPLYKRLGQGYLAWTDAMLGLVDDAELDWRASERARFAMNLLTSAAAPTNFMAGNPAAIERAVETRGVSVAKGLRNFAKDVVSNRGMPTSVDHRPFVYGKTVAATAGAVVHRSEVLELLQYQPTTSRVHATPVVVVPPMINKHYLMDLAPGRSFVEHAVANGLQVYCVSWRNPTAEHQAWGMDDYIAALEAALVVATEISSSEQVNAVGICAGGLLTTALLGRHAATGADLVGSATLGVTLLDFELPSGIAMLAAEGIVNHSQHVTDRAGVVDGHALGAFFSALRPNDLVWNYWVNNNLMGDDPAPFDVLSWNRDATRLPAALHRDFIKLFTGNALANGELDVLGTRVELGAIECDAFVMGAQTDHLTPWKTCYQSSHLLGGRTEFVLSSSGHVQSLVNPPGNPKMRWYRGGDGNAEPDTWFEGATPATGSWWEPWTAWATERAGPERAAPRRLGNRTHRPDGPAPGTYVLAS